MATTTSNGERPHQIVVWGATGFTGKLVAEYLANNYAGQLNWAIAGRSESKLEAVRHELARIDNSLAELPILVGDSHDAASLDAIASSTQVIASTVGPFAKYGSELVAACVRNGTDYCDITGETHWIRQMVDAHHEQAKQSGARIVHCCGYDSIPSDLGCLTLQEHARTTLGAPCQRVQMFVGPTKGKASGGTVASMINVLEEARRDSSIVKIYADPYGLNPEGERQGPDGADQMGVKRTPNGWTAPFLMAGINTRIVRRSNALMGYPYGRGFRYSEVMRFPPTAKGLMMASAVTATLGGFAAGISIPFTRKLLKRHALPAPGEGPSREEREAGHFRNDMEGSSRDDAHEKAQLRVRVSGTSDPGYGETAKMLAESALCLALDGEDIGLRGGVLTPASAMGMRLVERLRAAGMTFEVR